MTPGLCECGCGGATSIAPCTDRNKGWAKGRPLRFLRGHSRRSNGTEYEVDPVTGCWQWCLALDPAGYGRLGRQGHMCLAHRVYYEERKGPIPEGLQIDHLCCNPACVNPDHLEPVTNAENTRRGRRARLSVETVALIRASPQSDRVLAERLGVGKSTVQAARRGVTWSTA